MMEDVWLTRVIQYFFFHSCMDDIRGDIYPLNIKWMTSSKKLIFFNAL